MPLIAANRLKKTFSTRLLFEGISFEVYEHDKIGLVGVNGCGKTTLFRILTGEDSADEGGVFTSRDTVIATMEQNVADITKTVYDSTLGVFSDLMDMERELESINRRLTSGEGDGDKLIARQAHLSERYEFLGGLTYRSRTRSTLMGLGFTEEELSKPLNDMSGGQRNKAQLARVLLCGANLLLLDEPTNHLDIDTIAWLEDFLINYNRAFIVISHDRYFLDRVTTRTIEIKNRHQIVSEGNYSRHVELQSTEQEMILRHYLQTKREIKRIEGIVEQQRRWGQEHNFVTAASKQKQADRLKATLVAPEKATAAIRFRFRANAVSGNDVIIAKGLEKSFEKGVFKNAGLHIKKGERVFLLGPNGCGKTTLLNIIAGRLKPDAGSVALGANVRLGYYEQVMAGLSPKNTVLNEVWNDFPKLNTTEIRSALAAFLFGPDDIEKTVEILSGGEKARIQLLKLMLKGNNLLLLDEPTNHLDLASRDALERALEDYDGTMLIVTHDRYLVNRLAERILYLTADGIEEFIGGYDDFLAALAEDREQRQKEKPAAPVSDYHQQKQLKSAYNQTLGEYRRTEARITSLEAELTALNERMALPEIASDYERSADMAGEASKLEQRIAEQYDALEELDASLAKLREQLGLDGAED